MSEQEWTYVYAVLVDYKTQGVYTTEEKARAAFDAIPENEVFDITIEAWPTDRVWNRWSPTVVAGK